MFQIAHWLTLVLALFGLGVYLVLQSYVPIYLSRKSRSPTFRLHYSYSGILLLPVLLYYFFSSPPSKDFEIVLASRDAPPLNPSSVHSPWQPSPRLEKNSPPDGLDAPSNILTQPPLRLLPPPSLSLQSSVPSSLPSVYPPQAYDFSQEETTNNSTSGGLFHTYARATSSSDILSTVSRMQTGGACRGAGTKAGEGASISGLPSGCLELGKVYPATLRAGRPCSGGGDYWEFLLMGPNYLGRPFSKDDGDGNFSLSIEVPYLLNPNHLSGTYTLFGHLLFEGGTGFGGPDVDWTAEQMLGLEDGVSMQLNFQTSCGGDASEQETPPPRESPSSTCPVALPADHNGVRLGHRPSWQGYWLKVPGALLNPQIACGPPFCAPGSAPLSSVMADNTEGWVYRRRECVFRLISQFHARKCMAKKHIWAVGDSTMQDTVRNFLTDSLAIPGELFMDGPEGFLPRTANFTKHFPAVTASTGSPGDLPPLDITVTMVFAGHHNDLTGGEGVKTYLDASWVKKWETRWAAHPPDLLFANDAGLHSAQWAAKEGGASLGEVDRLLKDVVVPLWLSGGKGSGNASIRASPPPTLVYRSNVAPALEHRSHRGNPQSMEVHNALAGMRVVEGVLGENLLSNKEQRALAVIDFFDLTFPWHLHPCCSDGGHYGRPSYYKFWRSGAVYTGGNDLGGKGGYAMVSAKKFVDVMLTQIVLHSVCPDI